MAVVSMGTALKKGGATIANLTSIDGLGVSADTIETTALDTTGGFRTFVSSLKDGGEVSISGHFKYSAHNTLYTDFLNNASDSYTIAFPDLGALGANGTQWTFTAVVTAYSTSAELEDLVGFEATLKVSGKPTLVAPA